VLNRETYFSATRGRTLRPLVKFGRDAVLLEEDFVDISIRKSRRRILVEIRSDCHARCAIRKALSQIVICVLVYNSLDNNARAP